MMHKMILLVIGLLGLAGVGSAQIVQATQCGTISYMANFALNSFANGTWHEVGKSSSQNNACSSLQFSILDGIISVSNPSVLNNFLQPANGTVTQTAGTAQLTLTLSNSATPISFGILGSDYNNYAIAVNCVNLNATYREVNVWQLGRDTNTFSTAAHVTAANNLLNPLGISVSDLTSIDHSTLACTQLPVIPNGEAVILPGQCASASVPVVQNFNVTAFLGTWHEISSYYSPNAVGTCARADYSLVDGTVNVLNSEVLNQQLATISGTATLIGTDGSGRLSVTLNVFGVLVQQELLVIGTNYNGYAVSYSCVDLPNGQRQVNSWILSRTKEISVASQTAVNQVISSFIDLNEAYYQTTDQTDAGCFYYPTYVPGVPVEFPGLCDNNVAAVPNFNLTAFIGTWHEVEAYPKVQQTGTCVNHDFTASASATTLNLVSNQVVNEMAISASGSVTLAATETSGKLTLTLTTSGQTITFSYWILATDYLSYALAYSCENQPNGNRAVYSWKLSRSQTLPPAALTAFNNTIAAVQVLDEQYFETVNQSPAGCFYFPTVQPGAPVVFPGLCDPFIPVQANFDPTLYTGLWHDVESYPAPFQTGTCSNAYYTLEGGIVDVFNTQVINQQLDTINGTAIIPDPSQPAKLLVTFPVAGTNENTSSEYWILSTDYSSYSLVYSCTNLTSTNERLVFSWKLSRTKELTTDATTAMNAVAANVQVLDSRYYVAQDQSAAGCFYFPAPLAGQPVIFPGQCNDGIAAVPNFNLTAFTGTWHEVEAYPKPQQTGTCVNHEFSWSSVNSLDLVSNQVVNQLATSAIGNVVVDSNDASGKLILTLATAGQNIIIPYWILATDYTSYALAYSCMDQPNDTRAVYSWKLSRTQVLPPAAATPINTAIASVDVLNQQYYENVDQSAAACSSYPNIPAGDPIILPGSCGLPIPMNNFIAGEFAGNWYEAARYASDRQTGSCAASHFNATQNTFTITQTIVYNERQTVVSGTATLAADGVATMTATLTDGANLTYTTTIHILDTDYTEFALLYSCENVPGTNNRQIYSWKLSRSQSGLTQEANDRIGAVISNNVDLLEQYYQPTGQTNADCFYYPVFEGTPDEIILPGPCPAVSGVANFNPSNFLGEWYDVGRYPIASQFGSCPVAGYSLVDGVITISNTMVVNETLRVQNAIARLSSGGTGQLQVTYVQENGGETVATYFILGTDYNSYSVLYSCSNLPDGTRRVYSWKLSRTPTLDNASTTAINNIINNIQGLSEEYYQPQSHSNQDCFYVPEPVPGEPVLFRGACESVPAMAGFNPSQYLGWWHEIERYPSDTNAGQCTSANFVQSSANAINVVETDVYNGVANETTNAATITANGIITINRSGVPTTYTVLQTDYNSYSLLYACENVVLSNSNITYRRVWSAKHSKARTLTAAAVTAMAPIITANPVLHQHLYETVDQSDSACFHYREDAGEQVILPGQCDTSIPVQANFDITHFAGRWYQIERYPYPQVSNNATCIGARYTASGTNVAVQNWEVLNGTLNIKEGTASVNGATLTVTLPGDGSSGNVTTNLLILATDYLDYALAYTCVNINSFQRAVGAFKLSRSRQLTNAGQFAIQTYTANRQEFHQPYFINVWHHDDCDEPSSALLVKSSIIVMLVCVFLQLVM